MKPREFLNQIDDSAVVAAIQKVEATTSGEIRVFVCDRDAPDPVAAAWWHFHRLKMDQTKDRNGVLIFVAPSSKSFAVIGDSQIHAQCTPDFWTNVAGKLGECFRQSALTQGIVGAIDETGRLLARHFPKKSDDINELPDSVQRD